MKFFNKTFNFFGINAVIVDIYNGEAFCAVFIKDLLNTGVSALQ